MLYQEALVVRYLEFADQNGISPEKMTLGEVLARILDDDANCFTCWTSDYGDQMRQDLLDRLDWEIRSVLLPQEIKVILQNVRAEVSQYDWKVSSEFQKAYRCWQVGKEKIKAILDSSRELRDARQYHKQNAAYFLNSANFDGNA